MLFGMLAVLSGAASTPGRCADESISFTATLSGARITVNGTVKGEPEPVAFTGSVQIRAKAVTDPGFTDPSHVELAFDLSGVSGVGLASGRKYVAQSPESIHRPLSQADDTVEIDFPFHARGSTDFSTYRIGHVRFELGFHVPSWQLSVARGSIESLTP